MTHSDELQHGSAACLGHSCGCEAHRPARQSGLSRRGFVRGTIGAAAAGFFGEAGIELARPSAALAQTTLSPDAALNELMDGNRRFVAGRMTSFDEDLQVLKTKTAEKQEPFAAVLACADSRVPVELIFDQSIGHLFVARVAGNITTSELIASLEYGVAILGTKAIMVLGHANCGAVKAAIDAKAVPGQISSLYRYIRPAVDEAGHDLAAAIRANARIQARLLRESSPVIAEQIEKRQLKVAAAYYELASREVSLLD